MSQAEAMPGWSALGEAIATARIELAAAALDEATAAEADAYLMRVVTANLADGFLSQLLRHDGLLQVLPTKGGPNPDYLMSHAAVDSTRRYRIEGRLHDSERVGVGLYSFDAQGAALLAGYAAFEPRNVAADGRFALELAANAEGAGTLQLTSDCRVLIVRTLHRGQGRPATVALIGASQPPGLALQQGGSEQALVRVAQMTLRSVRQFIRWSQLNSANPNCFTAPPADMAEEMQGDPDTHYSLARYDLAASEWLEVRIPDGARSYWSLHAYNHWCEYLPGASAHDLSAVAEDGGRIRVHIGPTLAADLPNRIDTLGRRRGLLIFRTLGAKEQQLPESQVRR